MQEKMPMREFYKMKNEVKQMNSVRNFKISPVSMVTKENKQKIDITCESDCDAHVFLNIYDGKTPLYKKIPLVIRSGKSRSSIFLIPPKEEICVKWELTTKKSTLLAETVCVWQKPRKWTFYAIISSHTDIGLHNSQYIQRYNSEKFLDMAMKLCDENPDEVVVTVAPDGVDKYMSMGIF